VAADLKDRVGVGWRPELAADILVHLDRIDVVEVIADDHLTAGERARDALATLAVQVPVLLHGVGLGPCSVSPVADERLERLARLVEDVAPEAWSEHLAFVRAGGIELGHLAAPPRHEATLEGLTRNVARARQVVGSLPALENVASMLDPPGSTYAEGDWQTAVSAATAAPLLVDLHNLHAGAVNFGFDAGAALRRFPAERITMVHLAGGREVRGLRDGRTRIVDDHMHAVPDAVFDLLEALAAHAVRPLTVIIERDGAYPPVAELLGEVDRARQALARGRMRRASPPGWRL
jgi:uncharacterized protein (UPF0276 family)